MQPLLSDCVYQSECSRAHGRRVALSIWCGFDLSSIVRDRGSWWWRALELELKLSSFSVLGRARGNRDTERQALVIDLAVASSQRSSPGVNL